MQPILLPPRRRLLPAVVAAAAALTVTALSAPSASGFVDTVPVSTIGDLQAATSGCAGTEGSPSTVTLANDISAAGSTVSVGCHVILDLAGYDLTVRNVVINGSQALTIEDAGTGGSLTANAASAVLAGIHNTNATFTVNSGTVTTTGGSSSSGIGGAGGNAVGGTTVIHGGTVTATGGDLGSGIGGGDGGFGGTTTIDGGTVTATGGENGSGIGGGSFSGPGGGTTTIDGGTVTATGGALGAGIGGGFFGTGGTTTIDGGTVTATGGNNAAGIGGGFVASGGTTTIDGGTVTAVTGAAPADASAVGAGDSGSSFGTLSLGGGVLRLPSGFLRVPDSDGTEITIATDGVVDGSAGPDATYATIAGAGQIDNGGRILLPTANLTEDVTVRNRHFAVSFDTQGGSTAPAPVTVFADTFEHGNRVLPSDPTKADVVFTGWNTAADGTGDPVTASSTLPGSSADGAPVAVTAYAQWHAAPAITGIAPASGPTTGGTEVVITGTGFTGTSVVDFGVTGPATSYTVDSDTQITAVSPVSPVNVVRHIRVTTAGGPSAVVAEDRFTYTSPAPAVTGIIPATGPVEGGTEVVITGTGFTGATKVTFGTAGDATSYTVDSDSQITATSPSATLSGVRNIRVRTGAGTSPVVAAARFAYTAEAPTITGIAPSYGPMSGGTEVIITGTGFTGAIKVVFGIAGPGTSLSVDSDTQITVTSPSSEGRAIRHVRVTTRAGTSPTGAADRFTYQAPPVG